MARDPYDSTFSEDRPLSPERVLREKERERERESTTGELVKAKNCRGIFPLPSSTSCVASKQPL